MFAQRRSWLPISGVVKSFADLFLAMCNLISYTTHICVIVYCCQNYVLRLIPSQKDLLEKGFRHSAENWILCAPTGAGKTLMQNGRYRTLLSQAIARHISLRLRPSSRRRQQNGHRSFPHQNIGLFTGDAIGTIKTQSANRSSFSRQRNLMPICSHGRHTCNG